MDVKELGIEGAWVVTPRIHEDSRGAFLEWFRADRFEEAAGHRFDLQQANCSVSAAGTVRGIHFAALPPSQAKYVTCLAGAALDVVVDVRVGSPTYGRWEAVELDDVSRRAVYLSEGLGHAFMALADGTVMAYLCSAPYAPEREHEVQPLDPARSTRRRVATGHRHPSSSTRSPPRPRRTSGFRTFGFKMASRTSKRLPCRHRRLQYRYHRSGEPCYRRCRHRTRL